MSDALPLPPRPNSEQYKKLAKDLQRAAKAGDPDAVRQWATRWEDTFGAARLAQRFAEFQKSDAPCTLTAAQFFLARSHGFLSWPKFSRHLEELARAHSPISQFETAADAIVTGDAATLAKLLSENPHLVRARSTREHRSTLLHYVSANGIEDFRQKTPSNILEITTLLLNAHADVNAESDAYAGRSTTLGLTATSVHPEAAGVQLPLLQLLLDRGALIDGRDGASTVNACLANGRGPAAEFLASRGARLDFEGAAGVGRLDIVQSAPATEKQLLDGFAWACEFGRTAVVEYLLDRGVPIDAKLRNHGNTALHWAAYGAHADTVRLLLDRGAPLDIRDQSFDGTPLDWALHEWTHSARNDAFYQVVALLARAGAKLNWGAYEEYPDGRDAAKLRSDPRMIAALSGEIIAD